MNVNRFLSQQDQHVVDAHLFVKRIDLPGRKQCLKVLGQKVEKSLVQLDFHASQLVIGDFQHLGDFLLGHALISFGAQEAQKLQVFGR